MFLTKKSLIFVQKRGMKNFICGDIKFKKINYLTKEPLMFKNTSLEKKTWEYEKITYDDKFGIVRGEHGFSGVLIPKKKIIAYAFHTTKCKSVWNGIELKNIKVDEGSNPIKHVNPIQMMPYEDFLRYFKISEPIEMLTSFRYGKGRDPVDIAYCSLKAFKKSLSSDEKPVLIAIKDSIVYKKTQFEGDNANTLLTPSEASLHELEGSKTLNESLVKELLDDIKGIDENYNAKSEIIEIARGNYRVMQDIKKETIHD